MEGTKQNRVISQAHSSRAAVYSHTHSHSLADSLQRGDEVTWYADGDKIVRNEYNPATPYAFDRVFGQHANSQEVYETVAKPVVEAAMEGVNGTAFAYGVTSSGKTHTMHGTGFKLAFHGPENINI